jgi:hypothetical protein
MTGHLTYDTSQTRVDDLHRSAARHRTATAAARAPRIRRAGGAESVVVRAATAADRPVLERLAALDSAAPLAGHVLMAEVGGEPQAAIDPATGATIADPFHPTAHAVDLLRARAAQLQRRRQFAVRLPALRRATYRVA